MIKVGVVGATGYAGAELVRLLSSHPQVELTAVTSRSFAGEKIAQVYPQLEGIVDLECEEFSAESLAERTEVVFTALPHRVSMSIVPQLLDTGVKVIDLSGDYRYQEQAKYEEWYQTAHQSPELLTESVYGLPELHRNQIQDSNLVANPGCYATSAILALAPAIKAGVVEMDSIIVDAKSGVSGAGRSPSRTTHFSEVDESFKAYKVGQHRHTSEIEQELVGVGSKEVTLSFTPHLVPIKRGILSTSYGQLQREVTTEELVEIYDEFYKGEPFIRLRQNNLPEIKYIAGSNYCDLGVKVDQRTGRVIIVSAIDNLIKGASGQAIQNFNLMFGLEESQGLQAAGMIP
ncbi:MAG: N-acetyl-gamma-glutamyl-phosphate reductase [Bacillota bacterium]